jgi:hypothetical protein
MRGTGASAGTIKSGGAIGAAKMVVLDVDYPDIEDFKETKVGRGEDPPPARRLASTCAREQPGPHERRVHEARELGIPPP